MANHCPPNIRRYPLSLALVCRTIKFARHFHESIDTVMSSRIPSGHTVELSASYRITVVCLNNAWRFNPSIVSMFITLIAAPKSIIVFGMRVLLIWTSTTRLLGSKYLGLNTLPNVRSTSYPMTLIVRGYLFLLLNLLI